MVHSWLDSSELIGPAYLEFYSVDWHCLGTKEEHRETIHKITGISLEVLLDGSKVYGYGAASRMFWASKRTTTRVEDLAYCLMGLFDVNMPLLYGEREKAFLRLQGEILKTSTDHSLFAWASEGSPHSLLHEVSSGLLAPSPKYFANSGGVADLGMWGRSLECSFSNKGVLIDLFLDPLPQHPGNYLASLDCHASDNLIISPAIFVQEHPYKPMSRSVRHFTRVQNFEFVWLKPDGKMEGRYERIFVPHNFLNQYSHPVARNQVVFQFQGDVEILLENGFPPTQYDPQSGLLVLDKKCGNFGAVSLTLNGLKYLVFVGMSVVRHCDILWCHIHPLVGDTEHAWKAFSPSGEESFYSEAKVGEGMFIRVGVIYSTISGANTVHITTSSESLISEETPSSTIEIPIRPALEPTVNPPDA
jgi:hypothetical protein